MSYSGASGNNIFESLSMGDVANGASADGQHLSVGVCSLFTPGEGQLRNQGASTAAVVLGDGANGFQLCMFQDAPPTIGGNADLSNLPADARTFLANDLHATSASIDRNGRATINFDRARDHNFPGAPTLHFGQTMNADVSLGNNTVTLANLSGLSADITVQDPIFGSDISLTPNLTGAVFRRNGNNYTADVTGSWFGISQTISVPIDQSVYDQIRSVVAANTGNRRQR
jgi:hypothetical protein